MATRRMTGGSRNRRGGGGGLVDRGASAFSWPLVLALAIATVIVLVLWRLAV